MKERMVLARNVQAGERIYPAGTPLSEVPGGDEIEEKYVTRIVEAEAADSPPAVPGPPEVEVMEAKPVPRPQRPKARKR